MLKIPPLSTNQFVYLKPRVLLILLLGFSSGLPLALSGSTLLIWMKEANVDLATIGLFSLVGLPYSVKFFWAPVVDAFSIPVLSRLLGKRRAWLVATQLALIGAIIFLGSLNPVTSTWFVALGALIVATASATQDIVIDAYRVEALPKEEQAAGVAYYVSAYRVAMLVSSAGTIFAVAYFQKTGFAENVVWFYGYAVTAMLMVVGLMGALLCKNTEKEKYNSCAQTYLNDWTYLAKLLLKSALLFSILLAILLTSLLLVSKTDPDNFSQNKLLPPQLADLIFQLPNMSLSRLSSDAFYSMVSILIISIWPFVILIKFSPGKRSLDTNSEFADNYYPNSYLKFKNTLTFRVKTVYCLTSIAAVIFLIYQDTPFPSYLDQLSALIPSIDFRTYFSTDFVEKFRFWLNLLVTCLVCLSILFFLLAIKRYFSSPPATGHYHQTTLNRFIFEAWTAFSEFLNRPYVREILIFVVLFKFCDALAGIMTGPFVLDLGFDKVDYAAIVKGVGLAATLVGTFAAGALAYKLPLYAGLWIAALVQMLSNLVFVALAYIGPEYWALVAAILIENFTGALGTIIFIAYLSALCGNTLHTATQYAVLTALASVGRTLLSSTSGYIAEDTGWPLFFIITTLIAIPSLVLLYYLKQVGHFRELDTSKETSPSYAS